MKTKNNMIFNKGLIIILIIKACEFIVPSAAADLLRLRPQNNTSLQEASDTFFFKPAAQPKWSVVFEDEHFNMTMNEKRVININITLIEPLWASEYEFQILPEDKELLSLSNNIIRKKDFHINQTSWSGNFTVEALFLGRSKIYVELLQPYMAAERSLASSKVIILRNIGKLDLLFNVCVGIFVMLLNINFGAVLDLAALKTILIKPIGPAIGFIGQFIVMPILGFSIGYLIFRDMIELRLGIFFMGCTPGGGASNIFTVILNGNINLSITMTAVSNLAAFGMMPIWIFTLGALIFKDGHLTVPYNTIALMSCSLMVPLCIGIALQKFAPSVAKHMAKALKPLSLCFVIFITIFAFTVNSYIFKLFSWKIILASSALPWIGYIIGYMLALVCRQSRSDALTIAIETGIQNVSIAIFMLNFALPQPQADMTSAIPVANSMMTPLPLILIYLLRKLFCRISVEAIEESNIKECNLYEATAIIEKEQFGATKVESRT